MCGRLKMGLALLQKHPKIRAMGCRSGHRTREAATHRFPSNYRCPRPSLLLIPWVLHRSIPDVCEEDNQSPTPSVVEFDIAA